MCLSACACRGKSVPIVQLTGHTLVMTICEFDQKINKKILTIYEEKNKMKRKREPQYFTGQYCSYMGLTGCLKSNHSNMKSSINSLLPCDTMGYIHCY